MRIRRWLSYQGSDEQLQKRRLQAITLLEQGYTQVEVARKLGVTQGAVSQWKTAHVHGGDEALQAKVAPGTTLKLTEKRFQRLLKYLQQGQLKHGWPTELWTLPRIVQLIGVKFDVQYDQLVEGVCHARCILALLDTVKRRFTTDL